MNNIQNTHLMGNMLGEMMFNEDLLNKFLNRFKDYENETKIDLYMAKETQEQVYEADLFYSFIILFI